MLGVEYVREKVKTTSSILYKANVRLMCSNMEQIITVVGKGVAEIKALCQQYSKDTVGPFLKLGSLMKGLRKTDGTDRVLSVNLPTEEELKLLLGSGRYRVFLNAHKEIFVMNTSEKELINKQLHR